MHTAPVPQLVANLGLDLVHGDLGLEHPADALLPRVLEGVELGLDELLAAGALDVDLVHVAPGLGELALERPELVLEVVVGQEPGVGAVGVEELQVLDARGEVGGRGVGAAEGRLDVVGGGARRRGRVLGLVARRVEGRGGREVGVGVVGGRRGFATAW